MSKILIGIRQFNSGRAVKAYHPQNQSLHSTMRFGAAGDRPICDKSELYAVLHMMQDRPSMSANAKGAKITLQREVNGEVSLSIYFDTYDPRTYMNISHDLRKALYSLGELGTKDAGLTFFINPNTGEINRFEIMRNGELTDQVDFSELNDPKSAEAARLNVNTGLEQLVRTMP